MNWPNFNINVDLRFGKFLGQYNSLEGLLQVHGHFNAFPVAVRPILALGAAECGHAVLAINHRLVV